MNILNSMFLKWDAGTENSFIEYAKALQDCNFNVINLVHPKAQIINKLKEHNLYYIQSRFLGRLGKKDPFTIIYFKYLIKKHHINLILAHQGRLISLFKAACHNNVKLIGVNHGYNPKHNVGIDFAITLNTQAYKETIKLGQHKQKIAILPHSIDLTGDKTHKSVSSTINNNDIYIGSYGRLSPEKGYHHLIEALNILHLKGINFKAFIGGTGIDEDDLKAKVKLYNLEQKIQFIGWVQDKQAFYQKINLFILPSKQEEFSITLLEAMKYHTPILATKCHGPADIIHDQKTGFLVDVNNPKQMATKIEFIINNQTILESITNNAYNELEKKYSTNIFRKNLKNIINSCS